MELLKKVLFLSATPGWTQEIGNSTLEIDDLREFEGEHGRQPEVIFANVLAGKKIGSKVVNLEPKPFKKIFWKVLGS